MIDVIDLDEANEKLEWHARKLCQFDEKDPDALVYLMGRDKTPIAQWVAYLPEAKRFMIGVEAWFGHSGLIMHHSNGKIVEDAEILAD